MTLIKEYKIKGKWRASNRGQTGFREGNGSMLREPLIREDVLRIVVSHGCVEFR